MVNGQRRPVAGAPQQRLATGEPGKVQGRDREGIEEGSCGYRPVGSIFGENSFYLGTRKGDEGVAMWLNVVLTPG